MPFLHTDRGHFFYRQAPGHTPTLVFLHGNLGSSRWWKPILQRLPLGWHGIAIDQLGYGYSQRSDHPERYSVPELMRDLSACVEHLHLSAFHLVAHSTASAVAMSYALTFPQHLASLTLVGTVPASGARTPPEAYPLLERLPGDPELRRQALLASMPTLDPTSADFQQFNADLSDIAPLSLVAVARGLDHWQPGEQLRKLTMPVLLVRGTQDLMLSAEDAQQTLLAIPGANNLENLQGVGHSPMVEQPRTFAEVLIRFVAEDWDAYNPGPKVPTGW